MNTFLNTTNDPSLSGKDNKPAEQLGIVIKKTTGMYIVKCGERQLTCTLSAHLRKAPEEARLNHRRDGKTARDNQAPADYDPVSVGDQVRLANLSGDNGTITDLLPRRNKLARRSAVPMPTAHAHEQVIAANLDQVAPVFAAANPEIKWGMLDRYLVSAEAAGIPVMVIITKLDLAQNARGETYPELLQAVEIYRQAGYPVLLTSTLTGEGLEALRLALRGRISALLGKSGVGKTSLLNALQPGLGLRVNAVSQATGKGKHTTTHLEMFPLEGMNLAQGAIIDTPGVREFGLWEVDGSDLALYYPEMRPLVGSCRFGLDCQHDEEPGCAIRKAVVAGKISPRRYQSYLRLREEL